MLTVSAITTLSCSSARNSAPATYNTNSSTVEPPVSFEARQIPNERPELTYETLANDEVVIEDVWPVTSIRLHRNGFSEEEAREATMASWRELRVKRLPVQQPLTVSAL